MALKEYTVMNTRDWVDVAGKLIKAYSRSRGGGGAVDKETECNGIIQVGGYTRADGEVVGPYERICPYHYQGGKLEKEDEKQKLHHGFKITQNFSSDSSANKQDVINLKTNLSKMSYYKADVKSEKYNNFHGYPNEELVAAIKRFQKDNGLAPDGRVIKGGATETAINSKFSSHGVHFNYPVNSDEKQVALFDGKTFTLYVDDKSVMSWDAVSGQPGYQSIKYKINNLAARSQLGHKLHGKNNYNILHQLVYCWG